MKVILTDNFGLSGESQGKDEILLEAGLTNFIAHYLATAWNAKNSGPLAPHFAKVVADDYELAVFIP